MHKTEVTIQDMIDDTSLHGISTLALSAERAKTLPEELQEEDTDINPLYGLDLSVRDDQQGFRVALDTRIETIVGSIRCEIVAEYLLGKLELGKVPTLVLEQYVNDVAIMQILPFIRQGIADLTQRVFDAALIMPVVPRGEIAFSITGEED